MKISADTGACQAYGMCVMTAPDFFEIDEDAGHVRVLRETTDDPRQVAEVLEAEDACPVRAIAVAREATSSNGSAGPVAG